MTRDSESNNTEIDQQVGADSRNEISNETSQAPRKSLVAFLHAIKFRKPQRASSRIDRYFAQPRPTARQRAALAEERYWIRSAN